MAERTDRVEPRGPSRGQNAGRHNAREQDKDHDAQRQWIEDLDTKQLVPNNTADGESAGNTDDSAHEREPDGPAHDHAQRHLPECAPRAMRMPISRVRSATV